MTSSLPEEAEESTARNLTQAFEALCAEEDTETDSRGDGSRSTALKDESLGLCQNTRIPKTKHLVSAPLISPVSVTDPHTAFGGSNDSTSSLTTRSTATPSSASSVVGAADSRLQQQPQPTPSSSNSNTNSEHQQHYEMKLHADLKRDLSHACIQRVAYYSVIHDINKEASTLAAADLTTPPPQQQRHYPSAPSCPSSASGSEHDDESPLVAAVVGRTSSPTDETADSDKTLRHKITGDVFCIAIVDEEEWLLQTVASREPTEHRACPDTFLQAMGEREYDTPVVMLGGNMRTQLWKPSRSWWEAKSGKNPWIEPISHNKRWRYLWPLIHYHKFLAKCIKKLKRNGVEVKHSVSPVAVFLREEVCAVSDHLAALSLFDSNEWMDCLKSFHGWCDSESEHHYRSLISALKLRPVDEPGDVDSPLLRSQIDKHFLRSMANARAQLRETAQPSAHRTKFKPQGNGPPPVYPRGTPAVPRQIQPIPGSVDPRRQRSRFPPGHQYPPQQPQWWSPQQQWEHAQHGNGPSGYCDNSSVQSTLSVDSYQNMPMYHGGPMSHPHPGYHYQYHQPLSTDSSHASMAYNYNQQNMYDPNIHYQHGQWVDPALMYHVQMQTHGQYYAPQPQEVSPPKPEAGAADGQSYSEPATETPQKSTTAEESDGLDTSMSQSPFWSHLDRATMANLTTPVKASPTAHFEDNFGGDDHVSPDMEGSAGYSINAQPLLLQHGLYYGNYVGDPYGATTLDGYAPPSPATQFMMSSQNNFSYSNYGYSFSPSRKGKRPNGLPRSAEKSPHGATSAAPAVASGGLHKVTPIRLDRVSPSTVETMAETESLHEAS